MAVSCKKPRGSSSGTGKGLFLDLDIGYMDGSAFEHVIVLHTYDKCIFSVSILDFNRKVNKKRGMLPNLTS